jgi:hypothetical protein
MTDEEMVKFIEKIGRIELFEEIEDLQDENYRKFLRSNCSFVYPRYLKAVLIMLITFGYDRDWVYDTFKPRLELEYFPKEWLKDYDMQEKIEIERKQKAKKDRIEDYADTTGTLMSEIFKGVF